MRRFSLVILFGLLPLCVAVVSAQGPYKTVFPQIAVGDAWSSDFFVHNQGFEKISGLKLAFFGNDASPLVVQATGFGAGSSFSFDLEPGETRIIRTTAPGAIVYPGYAELTRGVLSGDRYLTAVKATMFVRLAPEGQVSTQLGLPDQWIFNHFSFAAEVNRGTAVNTGLALANPNFGTSGIDQDLLITLFNEDGTERGTATYHLDAGEHISLFLDDASLFAGLDNFRGTVSVSGPDFFGLLALRLEGTALGSVAINEGPVLAPFFLNQAAIAEVEDNDTRSTAQSLTLPVVVSGVISSAPDQDYFKFTGQKGDILNAMVETVTVEGTSELDSELYLFNSEGEVVAISDQLNIYGSLSENDSAIRVILPADGTYFLRVWDYWGDYGGSTFTYKLHVKIDNP